MKIKRLLVLAATSFMLLACNNGGGGKNPPTPPSSDPVQWAFDLTDDGESYIVTIESITATELFDMVIPSEHNGKPVTQVGYDGLYWIRHLPGQQYVKSVTFPDSITSMKGEGSDAGLLRGSENLERVVLSANCPIIPLQCFSSCPKLSEVVMPEGVTRIRTGAFSQTAALESISFPSTVTLIEEQAFYHSGLKNISWPESLADGQKLHMENKAFQYCDKLEEVNLPNYIYGYGSGTEESPYTNWAQWFGECTAIETFRMSGLVQKLYGHPFGQNGSNYALKYYTIPVSVTKLGENSLYFSTYMYSNIDTIFYEGTKEQWQAISKDTDYLDHDEYTSVITTVHTIEDNQTFNIR